MTERPAGVGFDLDMTLVDSRPGIRAALLALVRDTDRPIGVDAICATLGPPIQQQLAPWFTAAELPEAVRLFRVHMAAIGVNDVVALPGAAAALACVRAAGRSAIVVTAKLRPAAVATLAHAGLEPDVVVGDLWAEEKGSALLEYGCDIYVGDHPGDVRAARVAGALAVAVATGGVDAAGLRAAGADVVLPGLAEFVEWFAQR